MSAIEQDLWWAQFPTIRKAALEIAYDNGMINRGESEAEFLEKALGALCAEGVPVLDVIRLEMFLKTLNNEDLVTLCNGEHDEVVALEGDCPFSVVEPAEKVTRLLNDIFEC